MTLTYTDIQACYDNGRWRRSGFHKVPNQTTASGIGFDLSMSPGNPTAQYYGGSPLVSTLLARSTDGGLDHGANKSPYKKYLHQLDIQATLSTAVPLTIDILDYCAFYSGIGMDAGVQTFTNSATTSRYTSGLQMMLVEQFPYVGGATCQVTYKNDQGVSGKTTPVITLNTQTSFGTLATDAPATAGASGRFLPLARGDSGVMYPESIEFFGAGDVGVLALVLVMPIASAMIYETTARCPWDFLLHQGVMPVIEDDAYLNFICTPPGTLSGGVIRGSITTIWS